MSTVFTQALKTALDKKGITLDQYYDKIHIPGTNSSRVHLYFKIEALLKSKTFWTRPDMLYQDIASLFCKYLQLYYKKEHSLQAVHLKLEKISSKYELFHLIFSWLLRLHDKVVETN